MILPRPLPFIFLFFCFTVFPGAQSPGPADVNRKILEGILRNRGVPFLQRGESILIPGKAAAGEPSLVLAVPLAYPGEAPIEEGESSGDNPMDGAGLPLRFAAPLSLFPGGDDSPARSGEDGKSSLPALAFLGGAEHRAELEELLAAAES
ncbi:MAG: hypothetical protein LBB77_07925, partial [Treponema sp.]|nr:hypothetical protein [Treponema sp.]